MRRYVLLYHDCPPSYDRRSHWDFMLEAGLGLRTWALAQLPSPWKAARDRTEARYPGCPLLDTGNAVLADQLGDHRREYLEYEGQLSGNRGSVVRVESGLYDELAADGQFELRGSSWSGRIVLRQSNDAPPQWLLTVDLPRE